MIYSGVDTTALYNREPALANYLPTGQSDYSSQITEAKRSIIQVLKNNSKRIEYYCAPFTICEDLALTSGSYSDVSNQESLERMLLQVTSSGTATISLYGANDLDDTFTLVTSVAFSSATTKYVLFDTPYKYYKITTSVSRTITANLIESSFYLAHLFLSLALVYRLLQSENNDMWQGKAEYYEEKYGVEMDNMIASYGADTENVEAPVKDVWFSR